MPLQASHQQGCFEMPVDGVFGLRASFPDFFRLSPSRPPQVCFGPFLGEVLPLLELSATSVSFSASVVRWMSTAFEQSLRCHW